MKVSQLISTAALFAINSKSATNDAHARAAAGSSSNNSGSLVSSHGARLASKDASPVYLRSSGNSFTLKKPIKTLDVANDPSCQVDSYSAPPITDQAFPPQDQTSMNVYRYRQQQGVNLGSWFVHEKWMTPSLFKCAAGSQGAEIDIANGWGGISGARSVLEKHWDTFITQSDFTYLASIGINTVRLPIGYWNLGPDFLDGTPFESSAEVYRDSWPRVVRAINHAAQAGIGVLVDLHGAVGSQNGQQHSGVSDGQTRMFNDRENIQKTIEVLKFLTEKLAAVNNVVGIQLLNEPQYVSNMEDFYSEAIAAMRSVSPYAKKLPLYLHDGFDQDRFANYVASRSDFVVQDHHSYFVFTPSDDAEPASQHTADVHGAIAKSLRKTSAQLHGNMVIGEWSCALTPKSLQNEKDPEKARRQFCEEQMKVYSNATAGWAFWSYKKESCNNDPDWCFKQAVGRSLPSTFFTSDPNKHAKTSSQGAQGQAGGMSAQSQSEYKDGNSDMFMPTLAKSFIQRRSHSVTQKDLDTPHKSVFATRHSHRFEAIQRRGEEQPYSNDGDNHGDNANGGDAGKADSHPQQSRSRGYTDGVTTAKVFATYGPGESRVGFVGQYVKDAIEIAGPGNVAPGTEKEYEAGFMQGLRDGEGS